MQSFSDPILPHQLPGQSCTNIHDPSAPSPAREDILPSSPNGLLTAIDEHPVLFSSVDDHQPFSFYKFKNAHHIELQPRPRPVPIHPPALGLFRPPVHEVFDGQTLFDSDQSLFDYLTRPDGVATIIQARYAKQHFSVHELLYTLLCTDYRTGANFARRLIVTHSVWEHIFHAPTRILEGNQHGHLLPWNVPLSELPSIPPRFATYTEIQLRIGWDIIDRLIALDVLGERDTPGKINLFPFFIPKDGPEQFRFLVDGSPISPFLDDRPFHLDQLNDFLKFLQPGDLLCHLDMADAYSLIGIHELHHACLVFPFPDRNGRTRFLFFKRAPQGIKPSGELFNATFTIPDAFIRRELNLPLISYLDDKGFVAGRKDTPTEEVNFNLAFIFAIYVLAGGIISWTKSRAYGRTTDKLLGHVLYTLPCVASQVAAKRWHTMRSLLKFLLDADSATCRDSSKFGGTAQSCDLSLPFPPKLHLRFLYNFCKRALQSGWDTPFTYNQEERLELIWWEDLLQGPAPIVPFQKSIPLFLDSTWQGFVDASRTGLGGVLGAPWVSEPVYAAALLDKQRTGTGAFGWRPPTERGGNSPDLHTACNLSPLLYDTSSTFRELLGVLHWLRTFQPQLRDTSVRLFTDNAAVPKILLCGSNKLPCQRLAIRINHEALQSNTNLTTCWLPRKYNPDADDLSKYLSPFDYYLTAESFSRVTTMFAVRPSVDLFATESDRQPTCPNYISEHFQPGCFAVNALEIDWSMHFVVSYGYPPVHLAADAILHMQRMPELTCVLIVALWRNHDFIPLLFPDGRHFRPEIKAYALLERGVDILPGPVGRPHFLEQPYQGHRYLFAAVLWDTRPASTTSTARLPPRSHYPHRFCLNRHYNLPCNICG